MATFLQSIGSYTILDKLGRGGMGEVYLALDRESNRQVALKLVECGTGQDASELVAAERLGAQLQAHLCALDARVARIHSFGDLDGRFYIDMEYVEGRDLAQTLRDGPLAPEEAVRIAAELCSVLAVAHNTPAEVDGKRLRAIIHGDIKPTNIRLDGAGRVRVLDFGIAKGLALSRKLTSNPFASSSYSSPERLDSGRFDELSDLWAVGVVLYEMVDGGLPFDAPSGEGAPRAVGPRTPPRPLGENCPAELAQIIFKALARSPERRYRNAQEFEADLRAFQAGLPTLAGRESEETRRAEPEQPGLDELTRREAPEAGVAAVPEPAASRLRRRNPLLKGVLVAVPLLLACAVVWEAVVFRSASAAAAAIDHQQMDGDQAWEQYEAIRERSLLGIAPLGVRGSVKRLLVAGCDQVIDDYRNNDQPRAREADWLRCRKFLSRAHELDAGDTKVAAKLAYAEGHILRIGHKDTEAVAAFQRAASYDPRWPDPYLGMTRSYLYGLKDFERGTGALHSAEQLGHRPGKREQAQLADAHSLRGNQCWQGAAALRDNPQEKELLHRAKDDLEEALKLYSEIVPWGESAKQIRATHDLLEKVKARLAEVDPPSIFSWEWWKR